MVLHDHLFNRITSTENIINAHNHAKKGKGWYKEVQLVQADIDADAENKFGDMLKKLQESMINHTYHTSEYTKKKRKRATKSANCTNCRITLTE